MRPLQKKKCIYIYSVSHVTILLSFFKTIQHNDHIIKAYLPCHLSYNGSKI